MPYSSSMVYMSNSCHWECQIKCAEQMLSCFRAIESYIDPRAQCFNKLAYILPILCISLRRSETSSSEVCPSAIIVHLGQHYLVNAAWPAVCLTDLQSAPPRRRRWSGMLTAPMAKADNAMHGEWRSMSSSNCRMADLQVTSSEGINNTILGH